MNLLSFRKKVFIFLLIFTLSVSFLYLDYKSGGLYSFFSNKIDNYFHKNEKVPKFVKTDINGQNIKLYLVSGVDEMRRGLSIFDSFSIDSGMLFIFDRSDFHSIWMKDMKFSIDILWLDENFQVVDMVLDVSPLSYPEAFTPASSSKYVLELSSGGAEFYNIKIHDIISFSKIL